MNLEGRGKRGNEMNQTNSNYTLKKNPKEKAKLAYETKQQTQIHVLDAIISLPRQNTKTRMPSQFPKGVFPKAVL